MRLSGWLVIDKAAPDALQPGFLQMLQRCYAVTRTYENQRWTLQWYAFRGCHG